MDKNSIFTYMMLGFAVLGVTLAVSDPFDLDLIYAEEQPTFLQDARNDYHYDKYGQLTKSVSKTYDRILDYVDSNGNPVYVDSRIFEDADIIQKETYHGSVVLDKNACAFSYFNDGLISEGEQPLFTDSIIPKRANISGNAYNAVTQLTSAPCNAYLNANELIAEKNVPNVGILQYVYADNGDSWKTELRVSNNSTLTNQKFGFDQTIDLNKDTVKFNGGIKNIDNFNATTFDETWIANNQPKIIDFLNGQKYDFDLSFVNLNYIYVEDTGINKSKLVFAFRTDSALLPGETLILDPDFISSGSIKRFISSSTTSGTCSTTYSSDDTITTIKNIDSSSSGSCDVLTARFSLTGFPSGQSVASGIIDYTVSSETNAESIRVNPMTNDPDVAAGQTLLDDARDGTPYIDSDSKSLNAGSYSSDLGSQFVTDVQTALDISQTYIALGIEYDTELTRDSLTHSTTLSNVELVLFYNTDSTFSKPIGLSNESIPYGINGTFSCPENECSGLTGLSLWNSTDYPFAKIPLIDNAGSDIEYPDVSDAIDFSDNKILFHFDSVDSNDELQDTSGSNNNSTLIDTLTVTELYNSDFTSCTTLLCDGFYSFRTGVTPYIDIGLNAIIISQYSGVDSSFYSTSAISGFDYSETWELIASVNQYGSGGSDDEEWLVAGMTSDGTVNVQTGTHDVIGICVTRISTVLGQAICWKDGAGAFTLGTSVSVTQGTTHNVKLKVDGTTAKMYFNDVLQTTETIPSLSGVDTFVSSNDSTGAGNPHYVSTRVYEVTINKLSGTDEITLTSGLLDNSITSFPLNFTSTDSLFEGTDNSQVGGFVRLNDTNDFNLLAFNVTGNNSPTEIGVNSTDLYVRYNGADITSYSNDCNLFSWCFYSMDRNGSTFSFIRNGTLLGTDSSSQNLGTATNDDFWIGGNMTAIPSGLIANLDEYYVNDGSDTTDVLNIGDRGLQSPEWLLNYSNQTWAVCPAGISETVYCRVQLMNVAGNGTYSDLIYGVSDGLPDSPSITSNSISETQIDIIRTAGISDGGDTITHFDVRGAINGAGWSTLTTNSTIANFYNHTGLSSGDTVVHQWRDRNAVGYSAWSANTTAQTYEDIMASLLIDVSNIGDTFNATGILTISNSSPLPVTITLLELINNSTTVLTTSTPSDSFNIETDNITPMWYTVNDDDLYNLTLNATITNGVETIEIASSNTESLNREYDPLYFAALTPSAGTLNYTVARDATTIDLKMNRGIGGTWKAECITRTLSEAISETGGTWDNQTVIGYYHDVQTVPTTSQPYYISCYNDSLLFTTVSYLSSTNSLVLGLSIFDELGGFFGAPSVILVILALLSLATGRNFPIILLISASVTGILLALELLVLDPGLVVALIVMTGIGLFGIRKFY